MFRNLFSQISDINTFPIVVMLFFFFFFIGVIYLAATMDKSTEKHMLNLPLEDSNQSVSKEQDGIKKQ